MKRVVEGARADDLDPLARLEIVPHAQPFNLWLVVSDGKSRSRLVRRTRPAPPRPTPSPMVPWYRASARVATLTLPSKRPPFGVLFGRPWLRFLRTRIPRRTTGCRTCPPATSRSILIKWRASRVCSLSRSDAPMGVRVWRSQRNHGNYPLKRSSSSPLLHVRRARRRRRRPAPGGDAARGTRWR